MWEENTNMQQSNVGKAWNQDFNLKERFKQSALKKSQIKENTFNQTMEHLAAWAEDLETQSYQTNNEDIAKQYHVEAKKAEVAAMVKYSAYSTLRKIRDDESRSEAERKQANERLNEWAMLNTTQDILRYYLWLVQWTPEISQSINKYVNSDIDAVEYWMAMWWIETDEEEGLNRLERVIKNIQYPADMFWQSTSDFLWWAERATWDSDAADTRALNEFGMERYWKYIQDMTEDEILRLELDLQLNNIANGSVIVDNPWFGKNVKSTASWDSTSAYQEWVDRQRRDTWLWWMTAWWLLWAAEIAFPYATLWFWTAWATPWTRDVLWWGLERWSDLFWWIENVAMNLFPEFREYVEWLPADAQENVKMLWWNSLLSLILHNIWKYSLTKKNPNWEWRVYRDWIQKVIKNIDERKFVQSVKEAYSKMNPEVTKPRLKQTYNAGKWWLKDFVNEYWEVVWDLVSWEWFKQWSVFLDKMRRDAEMNKNERQYVNESADAIEWTQSELWDLSWELNKQLKSKVDEASNKKSATTLRDDIIHKATEADRDDLGKVINAYNRLVEREWWWNLDSYEKIEKATDSHADEIVEKENAWLWGLKKKYWQEDILLSEAAQEWWWADFIWEWLKALREWYSENSYEWRVTDNLKWLEETEAKYEAWELWLDDANNIARKIDILNDLYKKSWDPAKWAKNERLRLIRNDIKKFVDGEAWKIWWGENTFKTLDMAYHENRVLKEYASSLADKVFNEEWKEYPQSPNEKHSTIKNIIWKINKARWGRTTVQWTVTTIIWNLIERYARVWKFKSATERQEWLKTMWEDVEFLNKELWFKDNVNSMMKKIWELYDKVDEALSLLDEKVTLKTEWWGSEKRISDIDEKLLDAWSEIKDAFNKIWVDVSENTIVEVIEQSLFGDSLWEWVPSAKISRSKPVSAEQPKSTKPQSETTPAENLFSVKEEPVSKKTTTKSTKSSTKKVTKEDIDHLFWKDKTPAQKVKETLEKAKNRKKK